MWRLTQWIFHSIVILINKEVYILSVKKPSFNDKILWYLKINSDFKYQDLDRWVEMRFYEPIDVHKTSLNP